MDAIDLVAKLMEISATTAPKSKGENFVKTRILEREVLRELAKEMITFGENTKKKDFDRDAKNVAQSEAVVLVGLKNATVLGLDCAACGAPDCKTFSKQKKEEGDFSGCVFGEVIAENP